MGSFLLCSLRSRTPPDLAIARPPSPKPGRDRAAVVITGRYGKGGSSAWGDSPMSSATIASRSLRAARRPRRTTTAPLRASSMPTRGRPRSGFWSARPMGRIAAMRARVAGPPALRMAVVRPHPADPYRERAVRLAVGRPHRHRLSRRLSHRAPRAVLRRARRMPALWLLNLALVRRPRHPDARHDARARRIPRMAGPDRRGVRGRLAAQRRQHPRRR